MTRPAAPIPTELYLQIATVSLSNVREHWANRARRAKSHRREAYLLTRGLPSLLTATVANPMRILLVRVSPRMLDDDNLRGALKNVRDGIADRLGIDDRDPRVKWEYGQETGRPKQRGVKVTAQ